MLNGTMGAMSPQVRSKSIEIARRDFPTSGTMVIDCRSAEEYEVSHLQGAINIPLQHLSVRKDTFPCGEDETFYVYCRTGNRSATFVTYLRSIGYAHCQSIAEGYETWDESEDSVDSGGSGDSGGSVDSGGSGVSEGSDSSGGQPC